MSKRVTMVVNGKGGVGKSFFATNFVQYLKDHGIAHAAVDSDHENSTLKRFHSDAEFVNLNHPKELDKFFTLLDRHDLVVIDCRAACTQLLLDYFREIQAFDVRDQVGAELTLVMPVNHEADSVEQIKAFVDAFSDRCAYVIVRNEAHSQQFHIWDNSKTRMWLLEELAGRELTMQRMHTQIVTLWQRLFPANQPVDSAELSLLHRVATVAPLVACYSWNGATRLLGLFRDPTTTALFTDGSRGIMHLVRDSKVWLECARNAMGRNLERPE